MTGEAVLDDDKAGELLAVFNQYYEYRVMVNELLGPGGLQGFTACEGSKLNEPKKAIKNRSGKVQRSIALEFLRKVNGILTDRRPLRDNEKEDKEKALSETIVELRERFPRAVWISLYSKKTIPPERANCDSLLDATDALTENISSVSKKLFQTAPPSEAPPCQVAPLDGDAETAPASNSIRGTDLLISAQPSDLDNIAIHFAPKPVDRRIVLRSIGYQIDNNDGDERAEQRLCLRRIVVRWNWGQGLLVELEEPTANAMLQTLATANPGFRFGGAVLDSTNVRFGVSPNSEGEALAPLPGRAIEYLSLPPAVLEADETAIHRFELWAYWNDVRVRQREADGTFRLFDRAELDALLTEAESGLLALREYAALIEHGFPTDGQLHRLGHRGALVIQQPASTVVGASA